MCQIYFRHVEHRAVDNPASPRLHVACHRIAVKIYARKPYSPLLARLNHLFGVKIGYAVGSSEIDISFRVLV